MSVAIGSRDARVHTQPSNRANAALAKGKSKESDERRVVYKPVLENPYQVKWPATPLNVQNSILACLADLLPEVAEYHLARQAASRKRKTEASLAKRQAKVHSTQTSKTLASPSKNPKKRLRDDDNISGAKRSKLSHNSTPEETSGASPSSAQAATGDSRTNAGHESTTESAPQASSALAAISIPPLLKQCTFGINEVTKRLESLTKPTLAHEVRPTPRPRLRAVLVCRSDIDPPLLIAHLPILVATCNSSLPTDSADKEFVKLVVLPMGAEHSLAEVTGLRRVAVMALDAEAPGLERLEPLFSALPILRETWLAPPSNTSNINQEPKALVVTHVKQLKTTAPKDMKAAKEKRKREVGEAKERAKEDEGRRKKRRLGSKSEINNGLTNDSGT
ncbi:hypothetical protein FRC09_007816 [Ceratobasidium sp. 395]|nr:hypothetical protein FRC09_007816 [Ceratobasidium sp. 395]